MLHVGGLLDTLQDTEEEETEEWYVPEEKKFTYTIHRDEEGVYIVEGSFVDRLLMSANIYDSESLKYFHKIIEKRGVIKELREMGIEDGDLVRMNDFEFEFME
jgi:GTP-binding protein